MARKRHEEEAENHERWLVSYADFITLLFAFFVVMYAISSVNEGKYRVLSDALVSAFRNVESSPNPIEIGAPTHGASNKSTAHTAVIAPLTPKVDPGATAEALHMKQLAHSVLDVLQPLMKNGQVRVTQSKRGVAVEINAELLFDPGAAELHEASVSALQALAGKLTEVDNLIQIEGYTDNLPIRSLQYPSNWELSAARASSVVRLMEAAGVNHERLVAVGYGENRALADNGTLDGRAKNRRVTIMILSDSKDEVAVLPD